jgi:hypothetical protein
MTTIIPTRNGASWTTGEVSDLMNSIKKRIPVTKIAYGHGRTTGAIKSMLRKVARTYYFRDRLSVDHIQELTGLSEMAIRVVISEGPTTSKTDYIARVAPRPTSTMEFPITKDRLHNFKTEYEAYLKRQVIEKTAEEWSSRIMYQASNASSEVISTSAQSEERKKKMRQHIIHIKGIRLNQATYPFDYYFEDLFAEMKRRFPDMAIICDPLKTYILFDWN